MKHVDKTTIAAKYGLNNGRILQSWLRSLNFIRNVSAHHSRLWNINVLETAPVPDFSVTGDDWQELRNSRPFLYFCFMQTMMRVICPNSCWGARFRKLLESFPEIAAQTANLKDFGVVDEWEEWVLWETPDRCGFDA